MAAAALTLQRIGIGQLADIDLAVPAGEILCLSGPSGSGKTRLLRAIADLEPHAGEVRLGEERQSELPGHAWRRAVMLVPAESAWWFDSVGEHFPQPMPEALRALDFPEEAASWPVARLSSGEKQRLALVRALAHEPRALLLDEPTANLDPETTLRVEQWLLTHIRTRRLPALWVAHNREQIARVASRHLKIRGEHLVEA